MTDGDIHFWDERRGVIHTQRGGWVIGKGVRIRDYSLLDDLVGEATYFQSLILNVTGVLPTPAVGRWAEALFQCLSFPDPRIWCNQIGALGGAVRASPVASITAGILASDSHMYGPGTIAPVYSFLRSGYAVYSKGAAIETVVRQHQRNPRHRVAIPGFGRPIATADERVVAMERVAKALGLSIGPNLAFAYAVEEYLLETQGESMNLATYGVATMMDFDWTLPQIQQVCALVVASGVAACYGEAYENPPDSFLPLRCEDIEYRGHAPRAVPEVGEDGGK